MKSKLFRDTQGLDLPFFLCEPDKLSVCIRMSREAYQLAAKRAAKLGVTSGEYVERLILSQKEDVMNSLTTAREK